MTNTDNSLRAEIILLATKALDLLNKTLDLLAAEDTTVSHGSTRTLQPDNYRANTIRFNEQYLRDHYDLCYNTNDL